MDSLLLGGTSWKSVDLFPEVSRVPGTHIPSFFKASYRDSRQRLAFQTEPAGGDEVMPHQALCQHSGLSSFSWPVRG